MRYAPPKTLNLPMRRLLLFTVLILLAGRLEAQPIAQNITLRCNWMDTTHAPKVSGQHFNDVWGLTVHGKEYAIIGSSNGTHIIDVDACHEVFFYPGRSSHVIHRDFKTYKNYLYAVADEGPATLQVFDFSYLPDSLHLVYESDPMDFSRSHTIFIDTAMAKLYCASFTSILSGHEYMRIYSLQNPEAPAYLMSYNDFGDVHAVYVRNDTAYCSSSYSGYLINKFNTPTQTYQTIGGLVSYPYRGFNHSSWINKEGIGVMADETFGMPLKVIDTRNIRDPQVLATFGPRGTDTTSMPHNPYMLGHYAFISYYQDGLQVYDLSDPNNPRQAGYYDTYPGTSIQQFAGAWGCYPFLPSRRILVSDMQTGLYVLDASQALSMKNIHALSSELSIYPNPATDQVVLKLPAGIHGPVKCVAYNALGNTVQEWNMRAPVSGNEAITLPLPLQLRPGVYMLRAEAGGRLFTGRFTKL